MLARQFEVSFTRKTIYDVNGSETHYRATVYGEVTLTEGVDELICGEWEFEVMYDSTA